MTNTDNSKKFSIIAAVCFALLAVYYVIFYIFNGLIFLEILDILIWAIYTGLSVTLFIKNKLAVTIVTGIFVLLRIYFIIQYFSIHNLIYLLASAAILVILIMALMKKQITKKVWFIGGALLFVGTLIIWITNGYFSILSYVWTYILFRLIEIAGFFFIGLWLKNSIFSAEVHQTDGYATFNSQENATPTNSEVIGGADRLKMCKELLDSGIITQEEFETKKKEILGL